MITPVNSTLKKIFSDRLVSYCGESSSTCLLNFSHRSDISANSVDSLFKNSRNCSMFISLFPLETPCQLRTTHAGVVPVTGASNEAGVEPASISMTKSRCTLCRRRLYQLAYLVHRIVSPTHHTPTLRRESLSIGDSIPYMQQHIRV